MTRHAGSRRAHRIPLGAGQGAMEIPRRFYRAIPSLSSSPQDGTISDGNRINPENDEWGRSSNVIMSFWGMGLLNNAPYVIMLACAKNILEGGTAVVFVVNVIPSLLLKLTAPYWFDRVSYDARLLAAAVLMMTAFGTVAMSQSLLGQLLGVAMISLQCGLGEASLLALAGKYDAKVNSPEEELPGNPGAHLTAFSSGTGCAGPIGFAWKVVLNNILGISLKWTLIMAILLGVAYGSIYWYGGVRAEIFSTCHGTPNDLYMEEEREAEEEVAYQNRLQEASTSTLEKDTLEIRSTTPLESHVPPLETEQDRDDFENEVWNITAENRKPIELMSARERLGLIVSFWPYGIPLFIVYAAEYSCQSGAWTAIGFPSVQSVSARNQFYESSNWLYQVGVFVSRSSGTLVQVDMKALWIMPALQILNLIFFIGTAVRHGFFYEQSLLLFLSFVTGLLGGAVYVHGYKRVVQDLGTHAEFALATISVAEGFGVLVADIFGLYLQACLYHAHDLPGALVSCPVS